MQQERDGLLVEKMIQGGGRTPSLRSKCGSDLFVRERAGERDGGGVEVDAASRSTENWRRSRVISTRRRRGGGGDIGREVGMVAKTGVRWGGGVIGVTCGDGELGRLVGQRGVQPWTGPAARSGDQLQPSCVFLRQG